MGFNSLDATSIQLFRDKWQSIDIEVNQSDDLVVPEVVAIRIIQSIRKESEADAKLYLKHSVNIAS